MDPVLLLPTYQKRKSNVLFVFSYMLFFSNVVFANDEVQREKKMRNKGRWHGFFFFCLFLTWERVGIGINTASTHATESESEKERGGFVCGLRERGP